MPQVALVLGSHWMACFFGLLGRENSAGGGESWITLLDSSKGAASGGPSQGARAGLRFLTLLATQPAARTPSALECLQPTQRSRRRLFFEPRMATLQNVQ